MDTEEDEYKILGFTEIMPENIDLFVMKIVTMSDQDIGRIPRKDLVQIINTFTVFKNYFGHEKLWDKLEEAVYNVFNHPFLKCIIYL